MKSPFRTLTRFGLFGAAFCVSLQMAETKAALISYEGFGYAAGTLNGSSPGSGWNSNWTAPTANTIVTSSLSYPSGTGFTPTGNSISTTATGSGGNFAASIQYGTGFQYNMNTDSVRYASFLANKSSKDSASNEFLQLSLGGIGGTSWLFGLTSSEGFFIRSYNTTTSSETDLFSSVFPVTPNTTFLLVSKLVTSTSGSDMLYLNWYSPTDVVPTTEPTTWMLTLATTNTNASTQTTLQLNSGTTAGTYRADEIRLGTTWQDVAAVPEPKTAGLFLMGCLAALTIRRRSANRA